MSREGATRVLFVCVGNTCRSQMAEGFARLHGKDMLEAGSAGTSAAGIVNKNTIEAMKEKEIDISSQTSRQLTADMFEWADVVVTMGCIPADFLCPSSFKGRKCDWKIDDPLGRPWEFMRRVRDEIENKVKEFIGEEA